VVAPRIDLQQATPRIEERANHLNNVEQVLAESREQTRRLQEQLEVLV
jgi:hypothetical protein